MDTPVTPPSPGWYPCADGITRYWTGAAWMDPAPVQQFPVQQVPVQQVPVAPAPAYPPQYSPVQQPQYPAGYQQPQYPAVYQQHQDPTRGITSPRSRGMISLVGGILSVLFCGNLIYGLPVGVTGFVLGLITLKTTPRGQHGRGLATAGIVVSSVGVTLTLLIFIIRLLNPDMR